MSEWLSGFNQAATGSRRSFEEQLYFDEAITDQVHAQAPYAQKVAVIRPTIVTEFFGAVVMT